MGTRETVLRLMSDIRQLAVSPLTENGIYYHHDETDILKGYAMIEGRSDTPYFGGFYFFELNYPAAYPYAPPLIIFKTTDGRIRFNPNLYSNGKVCLSILNTWEGEPWSPCNTISSVLLSLIAIFNSNPLLNEPGITSTDPDIKTYNQMIEYENIRFAICEMMTQARMPARPFICHHFNTEMESIFAKNYRAIVKIVKEKGFVLGHDDPIFVNKYRSITTPDYVNLLFRLEKITPINTND